MTRYHSGGRRIYSFQDSGTRAVLLNPLGPTGFLVAAAVETEKRTESGTGCRQGRSLGDRRARVRLVPDFGPFRDFRSYYWRRRNYPHARKDAREKRTNCSQWLGYDHEPVLSFFFREPLRAPWCIATSSQGRLSIVMQIASHVACKPWGLAAQRAPGLCRADDPESRQWQVSWRSVAARQQCRVSGVFRGEFAQQMAELGGRRLMGLTACGWRCE